MFAANRFIFSDWLECLSHIATDGEPDCVACMGCTDDGIRLAADQHVQFFPVAILALTASGVTEMINMTSVSPRNTGKSHKTFKAHWFLKTSAGLIAGFWLALGVTGCFAWGGPGHIDTPDRVQFLMWMITPVWLVIMATVYFFRSGWHAWGVLLALNLVAWSGLHLLRGGI